MRKEAFPTAYSPRMLISATMFTLERKCLRIHYKAELTDTKFIGLNHPIECLASV